MPGIIHRRSKDFRVTTKPINYKIIILTVEVFGTGTLRCNAESIYKVFETIKITNDEAKPQVITKQIKVTTSCINENSD